MYIFDTVSKFFIFLTSPMLHVVCLFFFLLCWFWFGNDNIIVQLKNCALIKTITVLRISSALANSLLAY